MHLGQGPSNEGGHGNAALSLKLENLQFMQLMLIVFLFDVFFFMFLSKYK